MAVVSVRFNDKEIKILKILKKYYNCDYSSLLKLSLWDLYEEIKDKEIIIFAAGPSLEKSVIKYKDIFEPINKR